MGELNKAFQQYTGLNMYDIEKMINDVQEGTDEEQQKVYDFISWNLKRGVIVNMPKFKEKFDLITEAIASLNKKSTIEDVTEEDTYTIIFKNDEETVKTVTGTTGTVVEAPTNLEKEGYTFGGWSTDGTTVILPVANIGTENITYIAVWTEVQQEEQNYTITFKNGEEVVDTVTGPTGTQVSAPNVTKEGYEFNGWSIDGENPILPVDSITDTDITYTALWIEEEQQEQEEP